MKGGPTVTTRRQFLIASGALTLGALAAGCAAVPGRTVSSSVTVASGITPDVARALDQLKPATREAYLYAIDRPDVLQYIPCYCGCDASGHASNLHCFVQARSAAGVTLDAHGANCDVCVETALEVKAQTLRGIGLTQVRASVDRQFSKFGRGTHTPFPPA